MKELRLTQGQTVLVDDEDFDLLNGFTWFAVNAANTSYAYNKEIGPLHRYITQAPNGLVVDHIDGNGLNNQKNNLRVCTHRDNICNQAPQKGCSSDYKGVDFKRGRYRARIKTKGQQYQLGYFHREVCAAKTYDYFAKLYFGPYARLNFPD